MKKDGYAGIAENYLYMPKDHKNKAGCAVYYDKKLRQFVYCDMYFDGGSKNRWVKKIQYYAGPDRVSKKKDDKIGRFVRPVYVSSDCGERIFYDEGLKRFFRLDFRGKRQIVGIGQDGKEVTQCRDLPRPVNIHLAGT